jgi:hypothetical protein
MDTSYQSDDVCMPQMPLWHQYREKRAHNRNFSLGRPHRHSDG